MIRWAVGAGRQSSLSEDRYCHGCKQVVSFHPSGKVRRNANGRNVYHYAIFKCDADHTWNKFLGSFAPSDSRTYPEYEFAEELGELQSTSTAHCDHASLSLVELHKLGTPKVEIEVTTVQGRYRIDRLLGERLVDVSRAQIQKWLADQAITVSGKKVKPSAVLRPRDVIELHLDRISERPDAAR